MCESGEYKSLREVGDAEGLSGERIGQVLALLSLAPDIIAQLDVLADQRPPGIQWKELQQLTRFKDFEEQRREFRQMQGAGRRKAAASDRSSQGVDENRSHQKAETDASH